jgi:N-acetylmuramoyl-L-alanine amidase
MLKYTSKELDLMARLMRAEALSDGDLAMLMVGNVIVNRALATCDLFKNIRTISQVINQNPGGFVATGSSLFYGGSTTKEKNLAKRCLRGEYFYPATNALWFNARDKCSSTWFNMPLAGRYKSHCFYNPKQGMCPEIY